MPEPEARLIAFPPSVDTETARLVLTHHGVAYREVRQSAVGSALAPLRHFAVIPVLYLGDARLSPSRAIADYLDARAAPERRLLPGEPALAAEVETLWRQMNGGLAVWVAQWLYHAVLARRELALGLFGEGVPRWQAALDRAFHPAVVFVMRRALGGLDAGVAADALRKCQQAFEQVEARLRDGRRHLVGERASLADVAFCACGAALLLADAYGGSLPLLEELPEDLQREVLRFREREAGRFVLRFYAEHQAPRAASPLRPGRKK